MRLHNLNHPLVKIAGKYVYPTISGPGLHCVRTAMIFGMKQDFSKEPTARMETGLGCFTLMEHPYQW